MKSVTQAAIATAFALLAGCASSQGPSISSGQFDALSPWLAQETVVFENGRWFDGQRFVARSKVYVVEGRLVLDAPRGRITQTIDLQGGYVIPPLGDAHTHVFDGPYTFETQRAQYLRDGVFYALTTSAPASGVLAIRDRFSGPKNVDVVNAQAGFTGPLSHPAEVYNAFALRIYDPQQQNQQWENLRASAEAADDAYFVIRSEADIDAKWELIDQRRPDIIKVYLRSSEQYRPEGPPNLAGGGLDPALLPLIVTRAHAMGVRVIVANSTVADFRASLDAGSDLVTHLPCYQASNGDNGPYTDIVPDTDETCLLSDEDASRAGRAGMISTLITSEWEGSGEGTPNREWETQNVRRLMIAGAPFAIGSNAYGITPVAGLIAAAEQGRYSPVQLLRWATVDTPRAIFPQRRVGCLSEGCEASFLVLGADPLQGLDALMSIMLRIKDGQLLSQADLGSP